MFNPMDWLRFDDDRMAQVIRTDPTAHALYTSKKDWDREEFMTELVVALADDKKRILNDTYLLAATSSHPPYLYLVTPEQFQKLR